MQALTLPDLLLLLVQVKHLERAVDHVVHLVEADDVDVTLACEAPLRLDVSLASLDARRALHQVDVSARVQNERLRRRATEDDHLRRIALQGEARSGARTHEVLVAHLKLGPLDARHALDAFLERPRVQVGDHERAIHLRLFVVSGHEVHVTLLDHDSRCIHAEEGHWSQVKPLLSLRVIDFAALGAVVLACLPAECEDILAVNEGQRRVKPRRVHLRLLRDVQVWVDFGNLILRDMLAVLVESDATEDVDAAVSGLYRGGSLRRSQLQFVLDEGTLVEAEQPKILRVRLQPVKSVLRLASDCVWLRTVLTLDAGIVGHSTRLR